jgi:hypothetical protein
MCPSLLVALILAAPPSSEPPPEAVKVEGPAVVFVSPVGPAGDSLRKQHDRLREELLKKKIKAVEATPTLIRFGEEDNPRKRIRQVDFRRTPAFVGTVVFVESADPQIRQGLEQDEALLLRLRQFIDKAEKAKRQAAKP